MMQSPHLLSGINCTTRWGILFSSAKMKCHENLQEESDTSSRTWLSFFTPVKCYLCTNQCASFISLLRCMGNNDGYITTNFNEKKIKYLWYVIQCYHFQNLRSQKQTGEEFIKCISIYKCYAYVSIKMVSKIQNVREIILYHKRWYIYEALPNIRHICLCDIRTIKGALQRQEKCTISVRMPLSVSEYALYDSINSLKPDYAFLPQWKGSSLVQPVWRQAITWINGHSDIHSLKYIWKCHLQICSHLLSTSKS